MYGIIGRTGLINRLIGLFAVLLACVYITGCAGPGEEVPVLPEGKAVVDTTGEGEPEAAILIGEVVSSSGRSVQLTTGSYHNGIGSFHPDGDRIVFQSNRDGHWQIYELDLTLDTEQKLVESGANDEHPAWTSDGEALLFVSDRESVGEEWERDVYSHNPSTDLVTRLTDTPADDWYPAPIGGSSFVFLSERGVDRDIPVYYRQNSMYIGFADGGEPVKLADAELDPSSPVQWDSDRFIIRLPDGRLAVWSSEEGAVDILTPPQLKCGSASINQEKDWMVFNAREQGDYQLYIMDLNTRTIQRLNSSGSEIRYPQFSPDGSSILYTSESDGYFQLFQLQIQ